MLRKKSAQLEYSQGLCVRGNTTFIQDKAENSFKRLVMTKMLDNIKIFNPMKNKNSNLNLLALGVMMVLANGFALPVSAIELTNTAIVTDGSEPLDGSEPSDGSEPVAADLTALDQGVGPLELRALSYIRFREDISQIETLTFDSAQVTRDAHVRLGTHDSNALSSGWMAYAALIAADTPEFTQALQAELLKKDEPIGKKKKRRFGKKNKKPKEPTEQELVNGRNAFLAKLASDPRYPRSLPGAQAAINAVMAMSDGDYYRVTSLGESFKSQAYAMQKTRWGKRKIASSRTRLQEVESFANNRAGVSMPIFAKITSAGISQPGVATTQSAMWTPQWGYENTSATSNDENSQVIMDRILNLAARYAVGSINEKIVSVYAKNNKSQQCLSLVKLTLNQCIAATRTSYEEAFCLGEHALNDVADCVSGS